MLERAEELHRASIGPGDRVGVWADGSVDRVVHVLATLEVGAAYVPVDAHGPAARGQAILDRAGVRAAVRAGAGARPTALGVPAELSPGAAYLLATSGSTGVPRSVVHTHASALAFVDWCREAFGPGPGDRVLGVAPLYFDLSVHDLFATLSSGACLVLPSARQRNNPRALAELLEGARVTTLYSTPTLLRWCLRLGGLAGRDLSALRLLLFAGEVFPAEPLARWRELAPGTRCFNLYGPTESNVVTGFELVAPTDPAGAPPPIGRACAGATVRVLDVAGGAADEGELVVAGPGLMLGYWGDEAASRAALRPDAEGRLWLHTGDRVRRDEAGRLHFLGRLDRQVKRRGQRVEPGEVEACLLGLPGVVEAAVTADPDPEDGARLTAWLVGEVSDVLALRQTCSEVMPSAMVPDRFVVLDELPRTPSGKIDRVSLRAP